MEVALVGSDGVAPIRMVGVSSSVNLPLHYKVQKFSSGTGLPGWSQKKGHKMVVMVWWLKLELSNFVLREAISSISLRMTNYHQMGVVRVTNPFLPTHC